MAGNQEEEVLGKAYDSRLMRRLLGYLRPYGWQVTVALTAIILKAGCDVLQPFLVKVAIDRYLAARPDSTTFFGRWLSPQPLTGIAQLAGIYVGLLVASFLFDFLQTYYMQWTGQKVMFDLRSQIFRHLQGMHLAFFDRNPVGRLVTRVTTDVDALNEMFTAGVVSIFEDVFVLAGIIAVMLLMDWKLAVLALSVLPLIAWATMIFRKSVRDSYRRIRVAIAKINSFLQEHVSGMVVLQLFNRERRAYERFKQINASHMEAFKDAIWAYALYYPVVEILSSVAIAAVIWFGGGQVLHKTPFRTLTLTHGLHVLTKTATIGVLAAFIQYSQRFFRPIQDLSDKYNILQSAMASSERIFKLLDTPPEIISSAAPKSAAVAGRIEFDHVWFAYRKIPIETDVSVGTGVSPVHASGASGSPPRGATTDAAPVATQDEWDWILRDVSLTIEPGETVAVVGHTGAGKTTLISLLMRFYDVQRGSIRVDGIDVRDYDLTDLRRRFGVVLQDPFLFSGTIGRNIRMGSEHVTDEMVERAAEDVNIADFIRTLPGGFSEEVRERGSTLSTGQKQLISFARALAHAPRILILDEATSSVDTETEFRVRDALTRMVSGRTSLIIAHRLSTIQRADKIVVMHKGRAREVGSHQELLALRGIYWKLYQLQYKEQEIGVPGGLVSADD